MQGELELELRGHTRGSGAEDSALGFGIQATVLGLRFRVLGF